MEPKPKPSPKRRGKRADLLRWIEQVHPALIGEQEWDTLRSELSPISTSYLRRVLRESGVPLAPLIDGVRQDTFEALEETLLKLLAEYTCSDPPRQALVRRAVIEAKDHARWSARKPENKPDKEEMLLWMLTWLENPPLFPQWLQLRLKQLNHDHTDR